MESFIRVLGEGGGQGVGIPAFEKDQVLVFLAFDLLHSEIHAVLASDLLKLLDGRVVDLDVAHTLILTDQLLYSLLTVMNHLLAGLVLHVMQQLGDGVFQRPASEFCAVDHESDCSVLNIFLQGSCLLSQKEKRPFARALE